MKGKKFIVANEEQIWWLMVVDCRCNPKIVGSGDREELQKLAGQLNAVLEAFYE